MLTLAEETIIGDDLRKVSACSSELNSEVYMFDPSEHFRPEHKSPEEYRIYTTNQVCLF